MSAPLEDLALAALLHDVGKFWLHSGESVGQKLRSYCSIPEKHTSFDRCPSCKKEFGYAHAVLSGVFFQEYVPEAFQGGRSYALYHHASHESKGRLANLVSLADWLSSMEREDEDAGVSGPRVPQVNPVFYCLKLGGETKKSQTDWYLPIAPLVPTDRVSLFPQEQPCEESEKKQRFGSLWSSFCGEAASLKTSADFSSYFETLYYLLMKYTWCVPSAYWKTVPDVSLFDHVRTTCAIAVALHKSGITEGDLKLILSDFHTLEKDAGEVRQWDRDQELKRALLSENLSLVAGDISGVQAFLYTLTSQGVARGLKGRSFYLSLLGEIAARWLLRRLGLTIANLLYAGGGHFYILANRRQREELDGYRAELSRALLKHHRGDLYIALAQVPLTVLDFQAKNFAAKWSEVGRELSIAKGRRFAELSPAALATELFSPESGTSGMGGTCAVCHREGAAQPIPEDPLGRMKCDFCLSFEELGVALREAEYLALTPSQQLKPEGEGAGEPGWQRLFAEFGYKVTPLTRDQLDKRGAPEANSVLLKFNDSNFPCQII